MQINRQRQLTSIESIWGRMWKQNPPADPDTMHGVQTWIDECILLDIISAEEAERIMKDVKLC